MTDDEVHTHHIHDKLPSMDEGSSLFPHHLSLSPIQTSNKEPAFGKASNHKQESLEAPSPVMSKECKEKACRFDKFIITWKYEKKSA